MREGSDADAYPGRETASTYLCLCHLQGLQSSATVRVEPLFNPTNVGHPKGMNLGLARASAPFVCFLNNDILVPPIWLEELIAVAEPDPSIGTVCPASNTFDLLPPTGTDWLAYARIRSTQRGQWIEIPYGEGLCLLARTEVMRRIGGFDETTYEQIYFEDADLGRRIQKRLQTAIRSAWSEANRGSKIWIQRLNRWVLPWKILWKSFTKKKKHMGWPALLRPNAE